MTGAFAAVFRAAESQPIREKEVIAAVKSGDLRALRGMVKTDANVVFVKEPFFTQNTLMHVAAQSGRTNVLDFLLGAGFNVDVTNRMGETSLFYAAINGQLAAVELLLRQGAAVNAADTNGYTPLSEAVSFGRLSVAEMLLNHGANLEPLKSFILKHPNIVTETTPFTKETLLHRAALGGHKPTVEFLLSKGAAINAQNDEGFTALHNAVQAGRSEIAKLLLGSGADPKIKTAKGQTALDMAQSIREEKLGRILQNFP